MLLHMVCLSKEVFMKKFTYFKFSKHRETKYMPLCICVFYKIFQSEKNSQHFK